MFYFPMQKVISIDNQFVNRFVVQMWFRKNGVCLFVTKPDYFKVILEVRKIYEIFHKTSREGISPASATAAHSPS